MDYQPQGRCSGTAKKLHGGSRSSLGDRFSIDGIIFLTLHERLDVLRGLKTHILAQLSNLATPVMGSGAGLPRGGTGLPGESK